MLNERKLTKAELKKREDIVMDMKKNKRELTKRYGKDAEAIMYGRATKLAKQKTESMNPDKIREMIKDALQNPEKADLNKDGKLSSYEKKRGAAIEKEMVKEDWGSSDQYAMNQSIHRDLGNPTEFPGLSQIMSAAEDAVDFYWDEWEEYETDRDELVMNAARMYARAQFPEFMAKAAKMVEPIDESKVNEGKDDFVARHSGTNIILKKGYKYHTGEELTKLYNKIGELVKDDLHVKDVIIAFENGINEARGSNKPFNFSEDEVRAAANLIAKAISTADKVKTEVHDFEYDGGRGAGFDISMDGDKSEGGSYSVRPNGDVVNDAIGNSYPNAVYNTIGNKDINVVLANIKKYESGKSAINESKSEAAYELQDIMDQLYELSDRAKQIIRSEFPSEYSRLDAYGALDFGTSRNSYDVTFEKALENLELYQDEDEDMMNEDLDIGHQDDEPGMLKGDLYRIGKYAMELYQMMDSLEGKGEVDFPHWWQSKIVKAKDMVVGAKHYLDFELKEPQIDAMVDVAAGEDVIDENQTKEDILAQIEKLRVASNAGEIDGDEFLDKFMILRDKLKSVNEEPQIDAMVDIASEEDVIDEAVGGKPSQEEVDKFFEETFQETHYLASKPVEEWDEYDMSNWKAKLKKKKQGKPQFSENITEKLAKKLAKILKK